MSTILQALQRAEAERRLGEVPDLQAVSPAAIVPGSPAASRAPGPSRRALGWTGLGLVLLAGAAGVWIGRGAELARPAPAGPAAASQTPAPAQGAEAPQPPPAPAAAAPETAPQGVPPPSRRPAPPPPPLPLPPPPPAPQAAAVARSAAPTPPAQATPAPQAVPAALDTLPPARRAGLPALRIGGAIGAERTADRMLLVDGRVLREGDEVIPGLLLQHIGSRQAIFDWRGERFSVAY